MRQITQCGQAMVEFTIVLIPLLLLLFGLIDFGRGLFIYQILMGMSREGGNLYARGFTPEEVIRAVEISSYPLEFVQKGCVIVTTVERENADEGGNGTQQDELRVQSQQRSWNHPRAPGPTLCGPPTDPTATPPYWADSSDPSIVPHSRIGTLNPPDPTDPTDPTVPRPGNWGNAIIPNNPPPVGVLPVPLPGGTLRVVEVIYQFEPITPLGSMLNIWVPRFLRDAAYF